MIKAICLLALVAVAFAQYVPQTGPLSVTAITPGVVVSGSLLPVAQPYTYHVDLYSFWVPENVSSVNITFTDTDTSSCSYIDLFLSTYGLPCSDNEYDSSYQCANAWDIGGGTSGYSSILTPYDDDYLFHYDVNQYWYVAIGRYSSYDYTDTCTYQFYLNYNSTCPTGSVGVATDSSDVICEAYTLVSNTATPYVVTNANPTGNNDYVVFKVPVPTTTVGHIYVTVNSTSNNIYLYGRNYAGASDYTDYVCYEYSANSVGNFYIYDMFCYTPRMGDFFITAENSDTNWNGTFNFAVLNCGAGTAGVNCTFPLYPFNASLLVAPTSLQIPYTGGYSVEYGSIYFYYDIPGNYTGGDLVLFANSAQSGYLVIRRNGFPTSDSSSGYEYSSQYEYYDATMSLNQFDYQTPGRIYFLLNCYSSGGCNVTVSLNATSGSTSAQATTGTPLPTPTTGLRVTTAQPVPTPTTGLRFTTGLTTSVAPGATTAAGVSSSSAVAIIPSVFALAAALFAML